MKVRICVLMLIALSLLVMVLRPAQTEAQSLYNSLVLSSPVTRASWSPDGAWLAVSGYDGIRIYDAHLQQVGSVIGEQQRWYSIEWRPDGQQFAANHGENGSTVIWEWDVNFRQARQLRVLPNLDNFVHAVGAFWSPDGTRMITIGVYTTPAEYYGVYQVWDTASGVRLDTLPIQASYFTPVVAWSPDGTQIAGGGIHRCPDAIAETQCQSNGQVMFVASIANPDDVWFVPTPGEPDDIGWFQNTIAVTVGITVEIYEPISRQRLLTLETQQSYRLDWSPNGRYLAILGFSGTVDILEIAGFAHTLVGRFQTNIGNESTSLDWSVDNLISMTSGTGLIEIWDVSSVPGIVLPSSTPTAAPSPAASPSLREVFNAPTCAVSCWQGIEPGVTTQSQLDELLFMNSMSPTVLSLGNNVYSYSWFPNTEDPYIDTQGGIFPIQTVVGLGLVNQILVPVNISLTQVIAEYGSPAQTYEAIINGNTPSNNYRTLDIVYPSRGITFLITSDINAGNISQVRVSGSADISSIYVGQPSIISDCNFYGESGCSLATATPTATP